MNETVTGFVASFRETAQALRAELAATSEAATIRRVLDYGSALERGVLLLVLGHADHMVVKLSEDATDHGEAADKRSVRFLRGLLSESERVGKETLRPQIDTDGLYMLSAGGKLKPLTAATRCA
jgi:hypothetical protein